jgi:hypothetical protein
VETLKIEVEKLRVIVSKGNKDLDSKFKEKADIQGLADMEE